MQAMALPEQPFDEREQRYFLAEILKESSIAPSELLTIIRDRRIEPQWTEILLPHGRSVSACARAFNVLLGIPTSLPAQIHSPSNQQRASGSRPRKKGPQTSEIPGAAADRTLQPQETAFLPVNTRNEPVNLPAATTAPHTPAPRSGERPGKKRGRPSKAEREERERAAAERGEEYPPPKKRKAPKVSLEGVPGEGILTPTATKTGISSEGSTGKKKARTKAATNTADVQNPYAPTTSEKSPKIETGRDVVNKMDIDREGIYRSTIPETQATRTQSTDLPAQDSEIAGMQTLAAQSATGTMQSSSTQKGDSAPHTQWGKSSVTAAPDPATVVTGRS